ncbi:copper radical oxidase [Cyathus striatus]|nr:copper radical oxidase [Cyathus striatus]
MHVPRSLLALCLASPALAATVGEFEQIGSTLVSAMMMFLGNEEKVYILDKAEGNAAQVAGHPAWGSVLDISTRQTTVMDVKTNVFCSSGMHLPNGSFITLGGNGAVGRGGNIGSQLNPDGSSAAWDSEYQDFDGRKAIRVLNPCTSADDFSSTNCQWYDDPTVLAMYNNRWYSAAEPTGTGEVVIIGGFVNGGYVNRNYPNQIPILPIRTTKPQTFNFLINTSGLNAYAHSFLMASVLWDFENNVETALPDMPNGVVRVYPASGATIMFCGGSDMPEYAYGNYSFPFINTWNYPASKDCQRITPEPTSGAAAYEQDDDLPVGRTMGQFVILPDGTLFVVNGGENGTAGYAQATGETASFDLMGFGESLASGPVGQPAIYNPKAAKGSRWSTTGLGTSNIARLYHSSAILLPDASVLIAGSNPNVDVNTSTIYPTTYEAEIFYPPYFSKTRPVPTGVPATLTYGGASFDITIPASSYSGSANDAADNTTVTIHRSGFTTHAMNMGQRLMQLNNTYTVQSNGSIVLHVAQLPPNPNLYQPGPAFLYVVVNGVPSNGTYVIVGNGQIGTQPTSTASTLPSSGSASGSASTGSTNTTANSANGASSSHTGAIVGAVVGAIAVIGILGALIGIFLARRRRASSGASAPATSYAMSGGSGVNPAAALGARGVRSSDSSAFVPLQQDNYTSLNAPYRDDIPSGRPSGTGMSMDYDHDPYAANHHGAGAGQNSQYRY